MAVAVSSILGVLLFSIAGGYLLFWKLYEYSVAPFPLEQIYVIYPSVLVASVLMADLISWKISRNWIVVIITSALMMIVYVPPFIRMIQFISSR